jgi:hypothetical protein
MKQLSRMIQICFALSAAFLLSNTEAYAKDTHGTTATPDVGISLSTKTKSKLSSTQCVGQRNDCHGSIAKAMKVLKPGGTIYVLAGTGIADNLNLRKSVTICASQKGNACIANPTSKQLFHLIPKDGNKACIKTSGNPNNTFKIKGMHLRGSMSDKVACIQVGSGNFKLANSDVANARIEAVGASMVDIYRSSFEAKASFFGIKQLVIKESFFANSDTTIADAGWALLEDNEFYLGNLTFEHNFLLVARNGNLFDSLSIKLIGKSFQEFHNNMFKDTTSIALSHSGNAVFNRNAFDNSGLSIESGSNRIHNNIFGTECSEVAGAEGSRLSYSCNVCSSRQAIGYGAASGDRMSSFERNYVCTSIPNWLEGTPGRNDNIVSNCVVTDDKATKSASKSLYRPKKELYVLFLQNPTRPPKKPGACSGLF